MKSLKLGTLLNIAFFVALFVPMAIATVYSIVYYSKKIQQEALQTVSADLKVAALIYDNKVTEMRNLAKTYSQKKTVVFFFNLSLNEKLANDLAKEGLRDNVDMITLIDRDCKVISRSHRPRQFGDTISQNAFIEAAFAGKTTSGTETLSFDKLKQEGSDGYLKEALTLTGAAPVYDRTKNNLVGALIARRILNNEKAIVDQISKVLKIDTAIFHKQTLIAFNIQNQDKKPEQFANLTPLIQETVLEKGDPFEEVDIKKGGHLSKYKPLTDPQGKPVGILMVRVGADRYAETRVTAIVSLLGIAVVGFLLAFLIKLLIQRRILIPVEKLKQGTEQLANGYYSHRLYITYQDEIGILAQSFNKMAIQLGERDKLKNEFLSNTSHELRTPLNGIIGIAESLVDGASGPLSEKTMTNLSMIASSGRRLVNLVNDILDFSKMQQNDLELSILPVDIYGLTDAVLTLSQPLVGIKDVELVNSIDPDIPAVNADENRMQQILLNLVGNAIKFTDSGKVEILAEKSSELLEITVTDTGIGIPEEKFDVIFESFEQADGSTAREYGGTGLGLAITKKLVELHSGSIWVKSYPGQGSEFTFTCPVSKEKAKKISTFIQPPSHIKPKISPDIPESVARGTRQEQTFHMQLESIPEEQSPDEQDAQILIVDDEPVNLQVLANQFSLYNYSVIEASDGLEALENVHNGKPDLILLDVMMPKMSGYEVCQILRETYTASELPIILLTAKNQIEDLVKGFKSGANDYLTKPFIKDELLARTRIHLELSRAMAEQKRSRDELKKAKDMAESANRAKSEFLANMSHEIRTPMNAILGFSEILLGKTENPQHKNYISSIYSSGKSLLSLINDILDLSKIEAGRLEIQLECVSIERMFNEIRPIFYQKLYDKEIEFSIELKDEIPYLLVLDEVRIRQVLINVIGNAVKFTSRGYVKVCAFCTENTSEVSEDPGKNSFKVDLTFEVEDTGIGISKDQHELIFESFRQQDGQKTRKYGGTGLGLAITKRLIQMMNGSISVESEVDQGSVFRIVFPGVEVVEESDFAGEPPESGDTDVEFEPAMILLVDDVDYNREIVKGYLETTDFTIIEADSGEAALKLLETEKPDLVLMDLRMPGKDGFEVTELIKENDKFKNMPVIALTASAMKEDEERINSLFNGYLSKPINKKRLISELKVFLPHKTETKEKVKTGELISEELKAGLPEMIKTLETSFMSKWNEINDVLMMDEVEIFAAELKDLAQGYKIQPLIYYSNSLYEQAQSYNVDEVEKMVAEFPNLLSELKAL